MSPHSDVPPIAVSPHSGAPPVLPQPLALAQGGGGAGVTTPIQLWPRCWRHPNSCSAPFPPRGQWPGRRTQCHCHPRGTRTPNPAALGGSRTPSSPLGCHPWGGPALSARGSSSCPRGGAEDTSGCRCVGAPPRGWDGVFWGGHAWGAAEPYRPFSRSRCNMWSGRGGGSGGGGRGGPAPRGAWPFVPPLHPPPNAWVLRGPSAGGDPKNGAGPGPPRAVFPIFRGFPTEGGGRTPPFYPTPPDPKIKRGSHQCWRFSGSKTKPIVGGGGESWGAGSGPEAQRGFFLRGGWGWKFPPPPPSVILVPPDTPRTFHRGIRGGTHTNPAGGAGKGPHPSHGPRMLEGGGGPTAPPRHLRPQRRGREGG